MFIKYKLFLLCAKWIPVVTAIGILVTNTIAYYGCNDIVVDIFNFNIGTSEIDYNKEIDERVRQLQLINVFIRPIFSRIINNNIGKVNQALSIIADENGMIDADGILNDMIDNLIISPVKEERGIKIGAGNVEIKIPFINKAIALDKDDINEFKEMLSKIQQ